MNESELINELARELGPQELPNVLRQGIVEAVGTTTLSVKWGANPKPTPSQKALTTYKPVVGDVVWGVRDGEDIVVLGKVGAYAAPQSSAGPRTLAFSKTAPSGVDQSQTVGTSLTTLSGCFSGLQCGPVGVGAGGRLIRVSFKIWAFAQDQNVQSYYRLQAASTPSAGRVTVGEVRHSRTSNESPSPQGAFIFANGANDTNLTFWLTQYVLSGTGTNYYQQASDSSLHSWFLAEDISPT